MLTKIEIEGGGTPTTGFASNFCAESQSGCPKWNYGDLLDAKLMSFWVIWGSGMGLNTLGTEMEPKWHQNEKEPKLIKMEPTWNQMEPKWKQKASMCKIMV